MSEPSYRWDVSKSCSGGVSPDGPVTSTTAVVVTEGGYVIHRSPELTPEEGDRLYETLWQVAGHHNRAMVVMATLPRP
jgi:hypothetical protein